MNFGDKLKQFRELRGLSQTSLAKLAGISRSTINMYEHNNREPDFEQLEALADILNVSLHDLMPDTVTSQYLSLGLFGAENPVVADIITDLQQLSPEQLYEVKGYIKSILNRN